MATFDNFIGLPWLEGGRDRSGIDCWGLLALVYREVYQIDLPSFSDRYVTLADHDAISDLIEGNIGAWREVPKGSEQEGDGILLTTNGGRPSHVGVVVQGRRMLHIESQKQGSAIHSYDYHLYRDRIVGFYRYQR